MNNFNLTSKSSTIKVIEDKFSCLSIDKEKINNVLKDKKIGLFEISFQLENDNFKKRITFYVPKNPKIEESEGIVKTFVDDLGYENFFNYIKRISTVIIATLETALYPIHIIGFRLNELGNVDRLMIYYMVNKWISIDDTMGTLNDDLSREALIQILKELDLEEKEDFILRTLEIMKLNDQQLQFIGLNIEHGKKPSLKLYFK